MGENKEFERQYLNGDLEVELTPQGTLAEKLRAGGAGIPAFYTATGYGTLISKGGAALKFDRSGNIVLASEMKETREFNGKLFVLEESITGDVGIVKAWKADMYGNLVFRATARNFNPECAQASKFTIAEVEGIVEDGELGPDEIHLPGIYVDKVVLSQNVNKIEKVKHRASENEIVQGSREKIVKRAAKELRHGMTANLGIGMPTLASNYIPDGVQVMLQSENGLLGIVCFLFFSYIRDLTLKSVRKMLIGSMQGKKLLQV